MQPGTLSLIIKQDKQRLLYPLLSPDIIPLYVIPLIATAETTATVEKNKLSNVAKICYNKSIATDHVYSSDNSP